MIGTLYTEPSWPLLQPWKRGRGTCQCSGLQWKELRGLGTTVRSLGCRRVVLVTLAPLCQQLGGEEEVP